ncbi:MAG TPA: fatty acid desaturase [Candidatus Dormibacteraeota bacterium]|jgi:fatty acid desaturase|nr:fatty acid desaturase [Candidatus Dormibacteraeota bacterium]
MASRIRKLNRVDGAEVEIYHPEIATASMTMSLGSKPKLLFLYRWFAVLMGVASIVAAMPVAALSFGCNGAVQLLARVRALRDGYEFLSRAYDRALHRLGQKVLRDVRDTPALRVMVSLTLTVVPIFAMQLVLGRPRLWLVIAFYLSLYGLKFQRFVRMFSASHVEAHRCQGFFSEKYDKVFGRYFEFFLGHFYGNLPELGRTAHVCLHHRENAGFDDTRNTMGYDRTSRLDFLWYLSDNIWTVLGLAPYAYFRAKGDEKNQRRMMRGMARYYAYFAAVFVYDWRIGMLYVLVPILCMNFINAITAWVQHAFCDPERPEDYFANTVTVMDEVNFMNEGFHLCHHHRSSLHWTEMPVHFERIRDRMREAGSLVFRDLDFFGLFLELTILRRMDVLAEKLIPWEPMNHEQRLALLAKRTNFTTA